VSRADEAALPAPPRLAGAVRAAAVDFYYHSIRLVPANVAWGVPFTMALWLAFGGAIVPAICIAATLGVPTAGIFRLATLAARGEDVNLSDAFAAWRAYFVPALVGGVALTVAATVFATNVATGVGIGSPPGWALATLAGWGLLATWTFSLAFWPLLVDPARHHLSSIARAKLAALLVIAFPGRLGALATVSAILAIISTVAFAAIVTVSVAFIALITARYCLPAADRLEARLSSDR
jgi:hypothetical protein